VILFSSASGTDATATNICPQFSAKQSTTPNCSPFSQLAAYSVSCSKDSPRCPIH
jgi:hypothetical protein